MNDETLFYLLALQRVELVGDVVAKKLLNHFPNPKEIFESKPQKLLSIDNVGTVLMKNLQNKTVFEKAEAELKFIRDNNLDIYYFLDEKYPEKLKHCIDGPILMFGSGNMNFNDRKVISIVGTRQITSYGTESCRKIIEDLAPLNPLIVSGFAYGVDIVAHQAAMDFGLQTIGVLAHGLNQIYPKVHKKYVAKMEENGGFLTDFWSTSNPDRENFIRRNRIVAGMAEATLVIESAEKGGSLITANIANDYNRDVFALPGRATDKYSQGCNTLIKTQKANLMTSAADVIYLMNWDLKQEAAKPVQKQLFVELDDDEKLIYDFLQKNGKELLDIIAIECGFPIYRISSILLNMELKGVIRPLPGKMFEAV